MVERARFELATNGLKVDPFFTIKGDRKYSGSKSRSKQVGDFGLLFP